MNKINLEENAQEYITLLDNQKQRLEQQLSEANARIAMKDEALKEAAARMRYFDFNLVPESIRIVDEAILASPESIAAWEESKLLPLQQKVDAARNAIHIKDEAYAALDRLLLESINETKAAKAEMLPLQRQVSMQLEVIVEMRSHEGRTLVRNMADKAISYTQETAEAYDREHAAKVLEEHAVFAGVQFANFDGRGGSWFKNWLNNMAAELRASNKKGGE